MRLGYSQRDRAVSKLTDEVAADPGSRQPCYYCDASRAVPRRMAVKSATTLDCVTGVTRHIGGPTSIAVAPVRNGGGRAAEFPKRRPLS